MLLTDRTRGFSLVSLSLALTACGGGGGGVNSTPAPVASVPAAPTQTPTTPPTTVNYDTVEYRRSLGAVQANALTAYSAGATGAGITAAIIDSGIDADSDYFTGRISAASQDVASSRGIADVSGHGTAVAAVLGAARDGNDIEGMAFDATLLVLRTDQPGSCTAIGSTGDGCQHNDRDIARAIDIATANHARVINISLGGASGGSAFRAAVGRATAAGIIIVISAGNEGAKPEGVNPDPLALIANDAAARGLVLIAGATDASAHLADFSNKAGNGASHYIAALGDSVPSIDQTGGRFLFSGTSFSAPNIAGAVALLAQAFPNLSGAQIVSLLFSSADDAGASGVDAVYGNGVLNLARAFRPQGSASLAGSKVSRVSLDDNGSVSAPMGDAMIGRASRAAGAVILDSYDRAFALDLAHTIGRAAIELRLSAALRSDVRSLSAAGGGAMVALSIVGRPDGGVAIGRLALDVHDAERARVSAGIVATRLGRSDAVAFGIGSDGKALAARLVGRSDPAFLVAPDIVAQPGFARRIGSSAAWRHQLGNLGLAFTAETGEAASYAVRDFAPGRPELLRNPYQAVSAGLDRRVGPLGLGLSATRMVERDTVLGARFGASLGGAGARTWFVDAEAALSPAPGWSLTARLRRGWTAIAASGAMARDARLTSGGFTLDLAKSGVAMRGDSLALRVAQPLRISAGRLDLDLPVSYDYADGSVGYAVQQLGLAPAGRELDIETAYGRPLFGGWLGANLFWRRDPGNVAALPDDTGAAMRFATGF